MKFLKTILFGSLLVFSSNANTEPKMSNLTVNVLSSFGGKPIKGAEVKMAGDKGQFLAQWLSGVYLFKVPFGKYELSVSSNTFIPYRMRLDVSDPQKYLLVGLDLGTIDSPGKDSISGKISGLTPDGEMTWCRLIPLFGHESKDTIANNAGQFQFNNVNGGEYFLLTLHAEKIVDSRRIIVTEIKRKFDFAVGKK
ncbi:MAG: hypothetical protein U0V70_01090 [Terriglobia bacterium]